LSLRLSTVCLCLVSRETSDSIKYAFAKYIDELKEEKRIGSSIAYEAACISLESFKADLRFADITPSLLRKYESWRLENGVVATKGKRYNKKKKGRSITTVGIYLRCLRTIFNRASVDKSLYPFGEGKNKYSIPKGRNIKKALTLEEISKIFHYNAGERSSFEMARDYWIFIYLCNGLNVKDLCLLKWKNIEGDILIFKREKTKRSKKEEKRIIVSLKPETNAIISKWGQRSLDADSYIFPHLEKGMTPEREREIVQQLTKTINKYMKLIAKELEIKKEVMTYFARHSFATILKNAGASVEFISEAWGHSDFAPTKSYLASFETEKIHEATNALTAFQ
jgi:integrase/recombinase XerD